MIEELKVENTEERREEEKRKEEEKGDKQGLPLCSMQ